MWDTPALSLLQLNFKYFQFVCYFKQSASDIEVKRERNGFSQSTMHLTGDCCGLRLLKLVPRSLNIAAENLNSWFSSVTVYLPCNSELIHSFIEGEMGKWPWFNIIYWAIRKPILEVCRIPVVTLVRYPRHECLKMITKFTLWLAIV